MRELESKTPDHNLWRELAKLARADKIQYILHVGDQVCIRMLLFFCWEFTQMWRTTRILSTKYSAWGVPPILFWSTTRLISRTILLGWAGLNLSLSRLIFWWVTTENTSNGMSHLWQTRKGYGSQRISEISTCSCTTQCCCVFCRHSKRVSGCFSIWNLRNSEVDFSVQPGGFAHIWLKNDISTKKVYTI